MTDSNRDNNQNFPTSNLEAVYKNDHNRFLITMAVAKRARQIKEGSLPMIDYNPDLPLGYVDIALKELEQDKYSIYIQDNEEKEEDVLKEMDDTLNRDIEKKEEKEAKEDKKSKDKGKSKKSLAA